MPTLSEVQAALTDLFSFYEGADYCPNGLQVQGNRNIERLVTGVTASAAFLQAAIAAQADAILVHHGLFWKGDPYPLVGRRYARVAPLIQSGAHLFAYHLPLDAHLTLGNNVELGRRLGFEQMAVMDCAQGQGLVMQGTTTHSQPDALAAHIERILGRCPLHIATGTATINTVAWCTGAAQDLLEVVAESGADAFITGEVSERTVHEARELGVHFYAAGHHATERYGVQAVGAHLSEVLGIQHQFIDIENPV